MALSLNLTTSKAPIFVKVLQSFGGPEFSVAAGRILELEPEPCEPFRTYLRNSDVLEVLDGPPSSDTEVLRITRDDHHRFETPKRRTEPTPEPFVHAGVIQKRLGGLTDEQFKVLTGEAGAFPRGGEVTDGRRVWQAPTVDAWLSRMRPIMETILKAKR